jgi:hypothetical protein
MKKEKMKKICLRCTEHTFYNSEREADSSVSGGKATDKIKFIVSTMTKIMSFLANMLH